MAFVVINGLQRRLPAIMIEDKVYFIMGGTYQKLTHEKIINERYTFAGGIDRQMQNTGKDRWKMTLLVPYASSYATVTAGSLNVGDLSSLHTSADKEPPNDRLAYWDITALENFGASYTHYVYMKLDWESPKDNDPGMWQIPIELWGYA